MAATLAERSPVPFHLGLIEPIDDTAITGYPILEGAYDPAEQMWKLPDGTTLTGPMPVDDQTACYTYSLHSGHFITDDANHDD